MLWCLFNMLLSKCITCLPLWKCHTCLWTITLTCQNVSKPQRTVDGCRREAWVMHCCPELTKHYGLTFAHWDTQIQSVQGLDATWSVFKFQLRSPLNLQALSNWDSGGLWAITILQIQCFTQHGLCCSGPTEETQKSFRYAVSALSWLWHIHPAGKISFHLLK